MTTNGMFIAYQRCARSAESALSSWRRKSKKKAGVGMASGMTIFGVGIHRNLFKQAVCGSGRRAARQARLSNMMRAIVNVTAAYLRHGVAWHSYRRAIRALAYACMAAKGGSRKEGQSGRETGIDGSAWLVPVAKASNASGIASARLWHVNGMVWRNQRARGRAA